MGYQKREKVSNELARATQNAVSSLANQNMAYLETQLPKNKITDLVQDVKMAIAQSVGMSKGATLAECRPESIMACMINAHKSGVSLNPHKKEAYLVPYRNNDHYVAQLNVSFIGMRNIITRETGIKMRAVCVYSNEPLEYYSDGFDEVFKHTPLPEAERGELMYAFSLAKLPDGDVLIERMTKSEIDTCKKASRGSDSEYSPWQTFTSEMWKKSVTRRHCKNIPDLSNETAQLIANDEALAIGRPQDLSSAYEDAGIKVEEPVQPQRSEDETESAFNDIFETNATEVTTEEGEI